ncbi:hypothetical protein KSF78_0008479 [Schistosoma japonicum]|nr:hypothetical protein KSF78_0008479 [Schistosoma japonicum]
MLIQNANQRSFLSIFCSVNQFIKSVPWELFLHVHKIIYAMKNSQCPEDKCKKLKTSFPYGVRIDNVEKELERTVDFQIKVNSYSLKCYAPIIIISKNHLSFVTENVLLLSLNEFTCKCQLQTSIHSMN